MVAEPIELDELKPVSLKRKSLAQGDKVRYRVYTSPQEFVAVIAENALMAMKLSGVSNPHRILRDLPLAGNSLEPEKLMPHHMQPTVFMKSQDSTKPQGFEPMKAREADGGDAFQPVSLKSISDKRVPRTSTIDVQTLLKALEDVVVTVERPEVVVIPPPEPEPEPEAELTPEEVEKLLNEPRA